MPSPSAGDLSWQPLAQLLVSWPAGGLGDPHSTKRRAERKGRSTRTHFKDTQSLACASAPLSLLGWCSCSEGPVPLPTGLLLTCSLYPELKAQASSQLQAGLARVSAMSWPAGCFCSRCLVQTSRCHHLFRSARDCGESPYATQRHGGPSPCSHSTECLMEGHEPKAAKYKTVNDTIAPKEKNQVLRREVPGPTLVEDSKGLWRQLCSLVVGGLLRLGEGQAVQSEKTTPASMWLRLPRGHQSPGLGMRDSDMRDQELSDGPI